MVRARVGRHGILHLAVDPQRHGCLWRILWIVQSRWPPQHHGNLSLPARIMWTMSVAPPRSRPQCLDLRILHVDVLPQAMQPYRYGLLSWTGRIPPLRTSAECIRHLLHALIPASGPHSHATTGGLSFIRQRLYCQTRMNRMFRSQPMRSMSSRHQPHDSLRCAAAPNTYRYADACDDGGHIHVDVSPSGGRCIVYAACYRG